MMCWAEKPARMASPVGLRVGCLSCAGGANDCCPDGWSCQATTDGQSTTCAGPSPHMQCSHCHDVPEFLDLHGLQDPWCPALPVTCKLREHHKAAVEHAQMLPSTDGLFQSKEFLLGSRAEWPVLCEQASLPSRPSSLPAWTPSFWTTRAPTPNRATTPMKTPTVAAWVRLTAFSVGCMLDQLNPA